MDGESIHNILSKNPVTSFNFKGVYSVDTIPSLGENQAIIVNTDESTKPGSHWLAFHMDGRKKLEFFDSYGNSPDFYGLNVYDLFDISDVCWNCVTFQSLTSNVCGAYCIYYIYKRCQKMSMVSILKKLNVTEKNDFRMYQFVKKKFGVRFAFKK